jgi:hypothetical protein
MVAAVVADENRAENQTESIVLFQSNLLYSLYITD